MRTPFFLFSIFIVVIFGRILSHDFIVLGDDNWHIISHHHDFYRIWTEPYKAMHIPLMYSLWTALSKISLSPFLFHAVSLVAHLVNTCLVFLLCSHLVKGRSRLGPFLGAVIFAIHPFQVEPVAWASGMKDLFCTMFGLLALLGYLRERPGPAVLLFCCAVLFKPSGVVFAPLMALFYVFYVRGPGKTHLWPVAVCGLFSIPIIFIASHLQPSTAERYWFSFTLQPLDAIGWYFQRVIIPSDLNFDHAKTLLNYWNAVVGVILVTYTVWRRSLGLAFFLIALSPVLGFTSFAYQSWSLVADRYMYLPMAGISILVSYLPATRPFKITTLVFVFFFAITSGLQVPHWKDAHSLFKHAVRSGHDLGKPRALSYLGQYYERLGEIKLSQSYYYVSEEAYDQQQAAIRGQARQLSFLTSSPP